MVSCKSKERQTTFVEVVGKYAYSVFSINRQHKNSWLSTFQTYVAFVDFLFRNQDWETFPISWWTDGRFLSFLKIVSKWRDVGGQPGVATFPNPAKDSNHRDWFIRPIKDSKFNRGSSNEAMLK